MQTAQPTPQLLTLKQIIGDSKKGIVALIPVSRSTFENRVKAGLYPKPVKVTERLKAWRVADIQKLVDSFAHQNNEVAA